jgi:hypothetical protein
MLPKKVLNALGGKHRRKSTLAEQLELLNDEALSVPDGVALPNASTAPPKSVVVPIVADATSPTELPPPGFLAVGPTSGA